MTDPSAAASGAALEAGAGREALALSQTSDGGQGPQKPRSLWGDAWRELRRKPAFIIAGVIIVIIVVIAIVPGLFSSRPPGYSDLNHAYEGPSSQAWFGYDNQGYDVYARAIYGARASLLVGLFATLLTVLIGSIIGIVAGYYGRLVDSLLSRFGDIFA